MGGRPSKGTPADRRLGANQPKPAKPTASMKPAAPYGGKRQSNDSH